MLVTQDKLPTHPGRRRIVLASRADVRRARRAGQKEPIAWQEAHSPTEAVEVRLTGKKKATIARRRKSDARMWDAMSPHQQEAAQEIAEQFEIITAGTAVKVQRFERIGQAGYREPTPAQIEAKEDYFRWAEAVQRARLSHAAVIDVLILGESCHTVDKMRRKRKGWAKENLLDCLNIYCKQQGWPQNQVDNRG